MSGSTTVATKKLDGDVVESLDHAAIFKYCGTANADPTMLADALQRVVQQAFDTLENEAPRKVSQTELVIFKYL
jgi:hypothetical protein